MAADTTGQIVLTRDEDGNFCIAEDAGPCPGTDPICQVRKVDGLIRMRLDSRDPGVKSILNGEPYGAGYCTGHLYAIPSAIANELLQRGRAIPG